MGLWARLKIALRVVADMHAQRPRHRMFIAKSLALEGQALRLRMTATEYRGHYSFGLWCDDEAGSRVCTMTEADIMGLRVLLDQLAADVRDDQRRINTFAAD